MDGRRARLGGLVDGGAGRLARREPKLLCRSDDGGLDSLVETVVVYGVLLTLSMIL